MEINLPREALELHTPYCSHFLANALCEFRRTLLSFEEILNLHVGNLVNQLGVTLVFHKKTCSSCSPAMLTLSHKRLVPAREQVKITLRLMFRDESDPHRASPN